MSVYYIIYFFMNTKNQNSTVKFYIVKVLRIKNTCKIFEMNFYCIYFQGLCIVKSLTIITIKQDVFIKS